MMKKICITIIFAISVQAADKPHFTQQVIGLQCPKDIATWKKSVEDLRAAAQEHLKKQPKMAVHARLMNVEADMSFISLFWPEMLKDKVDYYRLYFECAERHQAFLSKPDQEKYDSWNNCILYSYGKQPIPKVFNKITECYSQILKDSKITNDTKEKK
jgi:hypothetical protein